jgi:outer membrane receptor protein involved in Fe transport
MKRTPVVLGTLLCSAALPLYAQDVKPSEEILELVIVTGSRVPRADLQSNSPVTSLSADTFQVSAETNIVRQLQELPAIMPARSPTSGSASGFTGSFVDLRGINRQRTLVLVDGRRWISTISDGGVDLSTIPPELIERVDIVTGGASATYGSDAIAGVVNVLMRKNIGGLEFNAQSGMTDRSESTTTRVAVTGGAEFANGRGSAYFHASYDETEALTANGRRSFEPVVINSGGQLIPFNSGVTGDGTAEVNGVPAFFNAAGDLFSAPGVVNELSDERMFNEGSYARVQVPADKVTFAGGISFDLNDRIRLYSDGILIRDEITVPRSPAPEQLGGLPISIDNPFLAPNTRAYLATLDDDADGFVQIPGLSRRFLELGPRAEINERDSYRLLLGTEIALAGSWKLDASAVYSESNFLVRTTGFVSRERLAQALDVIDGPNGPQCRNPSFGELRCAPVNIFGAGNISPEAAGFITSEKALRGRNADSNLQVVVNGNAFSVPAGDVGVAFGVEHRKATASEIPNEVWRYGLAGGVLAEFTATLEQSEAFGEAIVPLLKDLPFAHYVGLELGVRYTDFKPGDSAVTYKALGEWAPTEKLRIRGGLQRATRAPNPFELGGGDQEFSTIGNLGGDPCFTGAALTGDLRTACIANGVPVAVADGGAIAPDDHEFLQTYFGNPLLEPELAKTWTAGVVLQDLPFEGLTLTVDYYNIEIEDVITSLGNGVIADQCYLSGTSGTDPLCNEIVRNPTTGLIDSFDDGPVNAAKINVSGVDLGVGYVLATPGLFASDASLGIRFLATHVIEAAITPFAEQPRVIDCVGLYGSNCFPPRPEWRANTEVTWAEGPVMLALSWNWIGSIDDDAPVHDPDYVAELARSGQGAKSYFNLDAVWSVSRGVDLRAGIENVLDQEPPIFGIDRVGVSADNNTFPGLYDPVGRRFFAGMRVKF